MKSVVKSTVTAQDQDLLQECCSEKHKEDAEAGPPQGRTIHPTVGVCGPASHHPVSAPHVGWSYWYQ